MPSPNEYLGGFRLHRGLELAGHQLTQIDLKHETVVTRYEYQYPIVMIWKRFDNRYTSSDLIKALDNQVAHDRVIYTKYGNPYSCHLGSPDHHYYSGNDLIVNTMGHCVRV